MCVRVCVSVTSCMMKGSISSRWVLPVCVCVCVYKRVCICARCNVHVLSVAFWTWQNLWSLLLLCCYKVDIFGVSVWQWCSAVLNTGVNFAFGWDTHFTLAAVLTSPPFLFITSFFLFSSISVHVHFATSIGGLLCARHSLTCTVSFCLVTQLCPMSSHSSYRTRCAQPVPDLSKTSFPQPLPSLFFFVISSQYSSLLDHLLIAFPLWFLGWHLTILSQPDLYALYTFSCVL